MQFFQEVLLTFNLTLRCFVSHDLLFFFFLYLLSYRKNYNEGIFVNILFCAVNRNIFFFLNE